MQSAIASALSLCLRKRRRSRARKENVPVDMAEKESRAKQNLPVDGFAARVSLTASVCQRQNASRLLHHAKKDRDAFASRSCVAEKEGLEPSHRLPGLHP